ncbi:MAG: Tic22 family protein [Cyanobacteria bacterium P01_H01_bin.58]
MKGMIGKLKTLGLASAAVASTLVLMLPKSALALTQQEIVEKLNNVPVFMIVNAEGQSLTASAGEDGSGIQVPIVFIDSAEAQAFLNQAEAEEAEFAEEAQVAILPLSEIYSEASEQLESANSLVYIPSTESVNVASQLVNADIQGVPLYAAVDLDNEQYLLTAENKLPMFFSIQDLQSQLTQLVASNPEVEGSLGVEVVTFESILGNMIEDDPELDQFLQLIQFVPASQTLQYLESLTQGAQ